MGLAQYVAWCEHGEGTWWTARMRQAQQIEMDCLQDALSRPRPAPLPAGYAWMGGPADPLDSCSFRDGEVAA